MPPAGRPRPSEAAYDGACRPSRNIARSRCRGESRSRPHRHVPPPESHGISERDSRFARPSRSMSRRSCRATTRAMASTTSASAACRRCCSSAICRPRRKSAASRWERPCVRPAPRPSFCPPDLTQEDHFDGQPFGTRAGTSVRYTFPADGEYQFELRLTRDRNELIEGLTEPHQFEVSVDGVRQQVFTLKPAPRTGPVDTVAPQYAPEQAVDAHLNFRARVTGGPHVVQAAFIKRPSALIETERQPYLASYNSDRTPRTQPALYSVSIAGPFNPSGIGETPSRKRIFSCHPAKASDEAACARTILSTLARRAYRRPATNAEVQTLLEFLQAGARRRQLRARRRDGAARHADEPGVPVPHRAGALLAKATEGKPGAYRIERSRAGVAAVVLPVEQHSRRPAARCRGERAPEGCRRCSSSRCAACWPTRAPRRWSTTSPRSGCTCATSTTHKPDTRLFPDFDDNLRQAFRRETELLFQSVMKEDRSVLDLLRADYTFLNRAPREALRHSERVRQPLQARRARQGSRARRAARPGQHHDRHVVREPDVAGAPRQVDSRKPARHARAAAAAECAAAARKQSRARRF